MTATVRVFFARNINCDAAIGWSAPIIDSPEPSSEIWVIATELRHDGTTQPYDRFQTLMELMHNLAIPWDL